MAGGVHRLERSRVGRAAVTRSPEMSQRAQGWKAREQRNLRILDNLDVRFGVRDPTAEVNSESVSPTVATEFAHDVRPCPAPSPRADPGLGSGRHKAFIRTCGERLHGNNQLPVYL